jgi:hypothetical protein
MDRLLKKLDAKYAKYIVIKIVSSYSYRLDTPLGIYNVFYIRLLKLVKSSPLPSQVIHELQPPAL